MARQNGSSVSTPQGAKCVAEKLNRGVLVRHVEQTLLSCVHIYFLRWLVNEFRLTIYVFACVCAVWQNTKPSELEALRVSCRLLIWTDGNPSLSLCSLRCSASGWITHAGPETDPHAEGRKEKTKTKQANTNTRTERQDYTAALRTSKHTGTWTNKPCVQTQKKAGLQCSDASDSWGSAAGRVIKDVKGPLVLAQSLFIWWQQLSL